MEAGAEKPNRGRVLLPAGMNEAWRIFCRPGTKFVELYECRGTSFMAYRSQVKVQRVLLKALARSRYNALQICLGSRNKLQKM
jgi:hypothetical protein